MKISVITLMVLVCITTSAQNINLEKATTYYKEAVAFESKNIDSSLIYTEKAYQVLTPKDTLNQTFSEILNQYGRIYFFKKDYKKAYAYFYRWYYVSIATNQEADAYKV
jgi:hypothetical protein